MYRLSVPIMLSSLMTDQREIYMEQCKQAQVDRVFVAVAELIDIEDDARDRLFVQMEEALRLVRSHGFEAWLWISVNGHGVVLNHEIGSHKRARFPTLVRLDGEAWNATRCPLDEGYRTYLAGLFRRLARLDADGIMLDDDFRLSQHHPEFCCVCERHMARMQEACGEPIRREDVRTLVFSGKPNKYRDAWLKAQGDSLYELARLIRRSVDDVKPDLPIAYCTSNTVWDIDGTDPVELAKQFAGNNPPMMRLTGALYSLYASGKSYFMILEVARSLAAICKERGVELMAEGDTYPRPRYHVPAAYLEFYDMLMRMDGTYDGILKYMFDYISTAEYETGYLTRHVRHASLYRELDRLFGEGEACGVNVVLRRHLIADADFSLSPADYYSPFASAGILLANAGVSTVYGGRGICNAIFGENARAATEEELGEGVLLDAVSARILQERGTDVGLRGEQRCCSGKAGMFVSGDGSERAGCRFGQGTFLQTELAETAQVELSVLVDGKQMPVVYRYVNADGKRFLVFLFDLMSFDKNSSVIRGYLVQRITVSGVEWVAGKRLPAVSLGNPNLYLFCKRTEDTLSVAMLNCFADEIIEPCVTLDGVYDSVEFVNASGHLEGDRVYLDAPLPAFSSAFFRVRRA